MRGLLILGAAAVLLMGGCRKDEPIVPGGRGLLPPQLASDHPPPSYRKLVERYNARIVGIDQLWSRSRLKIEWRDDKGDVRREDGEGNFIFRRPLDLALTAGKLGNVGLWIGSNAEEYWLLDLQGDGAAYVGRHRYVGRPCAQPLPLAVYPSDLLLVMGLAPIDPTAAAEVEMIEGRALIEPPGLGARLLLEPDTGRAVRIDLLDREGRSVIVCRLNEEARLTPAAVIPTAIDLYVVNSDAKLTLKLSDLQIDGRKIKDAVFNIGVLLNAHKPEEQVLLDADCGE